MEAEKVAAEKAEAERLEAEKIAAEKAEAERLEAEKIAAEQAEAERLEAEKIAAEKAEAERLEAEKIAAEKAEAERLEAEKIAAEKAEAERLEAEKIAAEKAEAERLEAEKNAAEKAEAERLESEETAEENVEAETPAADIEFGELVEDFDAPGYKYSSADDASEENAGLDIDEEVDLDPKVGQPISDTDEDDSHDYEAEDLEDEIDDDVACELQEDEYDKDLDESEIINPLPSAKTKLQAQIQDKAEQAMAVGGKVKDSIASIKFADSIAKVQSLGKKEKIFAGTFAVILMLAVMSGVFMPASDSTIEQGSNQTEVINDKTQASKTVGLEKKKETKPKQVDGAKTVEQKKTKDGSDVKVEGSKQQIASLSSMMSSLKNILQQKAVEGKSSEKEGVNDIKPTTIEKPKAEPAKNSEVKTQATKKQAKANNKKAKPAVKQNKLEKALSAKSLDKSLIASFKELFKLWRLNYDSTNGKTACEKSQTRGLSCFFNTGSVEQLIRFNRPVILKFKKSKGFNYALLVKLSSKSATLDFGGEFKRFSVSDLKKVWGGKYITLWRPPKLSKMVVKPGEEGDHVRWLTMMMDRYDGKKTPRVDRSIYDENLRVRVDAFQKNFKLTVDGIIGKSTMAYLMAAARIPGVPLLSKSN